MRRIVYRPYRTYIAVAPFLAFISIGFLWMGMLCMHEDVLIAIMLLIIGMITVILTILLYKTARIKIVLDQDGIEICRANAINNYYVPWQRVKYRYLSKNYKGYNFWVLSPKILNEKQVKEYTNKGANTSSVYVGDVVVLFIDPIQNTSEVEEIIQDKIRYMDGDGGTILTDNQRGRRVRPQSPPFEGGGRALKKT